MLAADPASAAHPRMNQVQSPSLTELGGKYRILAELGEGGTATVSLAVARGPSGFSKLVVLKVMKASLLQEHEFSQMFMNEARLAARLNHPNIVQTNEVFEHHGLPVIVMEYLEGQAMSSVLSRSRGTQKFPLPMQLRVISDVLAALQYSHDLTDFDGTPLDVVHRDISPHNVFITFDGQVKLLDFGIAKLSGSHVETAAGVIKGKIRYMAPEQVTGENVDRRADLFAVGVMMWEAATGTRLWQGLNEAAVMNALLNSEIPKPSSVGEVDPALERIIMKTLSLDPAKRPSSAFELQGEIDDYLATLGTQVRPREIGRAVSSLFEDVRAQTKRVIEAQLSKVVSLSDKEYAETQPLELTSLALTHSGASQISEKRSVTQVGRPKLALFAGLAVVAAAVSGVLLLRSPDPKDAPENPSLGAPAPASTQVTLRLTAFPGSAKIYLDGELMPSNPLNKAFHKDEQQHTLRFEAPGHDTEERKLTFEQDSEIVVSLRETPKPVVSAPSATAEKKPSNGASKPRPVVKKPSVSCDPPFVVDARGVKRYKPECL
jgi:serine/threonine-protein kinase